MLHMLDIVQSWDLNVDSVLRELVGCWPPQFQISVPHPHPVTLMSTR